VKYCPFQLYYVHKLQGAGYFCLRCHLGFNQISELAVHVDNEQTHQSRDSVPFTKNVSSSCTTVKLRKMAGVIGACAQAKKIGTCESSVKIARSMPVVEKMH
jgi:hypothetical protein